MTNCSIPTRFVTELRYIQQLEGLQTAAYFRNEDEFLQPHAHEIKKYVT